jgi:hypothetical protein
MAATDGPEKRPKNMSLPVDLLEWLRDFAHAERRHESDVTAEALQQYRARVERKGK